MRRWRILKSCFFKPLHHLCKHGVLVENRSRCESLPALRATITRLFAAMCVPVVFNAVQAVIVSTGNCYWILKLVQADWTTEMIIVFKTLLCHSWKSVFALGTSDDTINLHCYFQYWECKCSCCVTCLTGTGISTLSAKYLNLKKKPYQVKIWTHLKKLYV